MNDSLIKRLCDFVDASPTAYHAVDAMAATLAARGARRLSERGAWNLEPGSLYFVERSGSALIAFRPGLAQPAEAGFALAGAHTDSPALKARLEKSLSGKGMERVAVEVYGGAILSSWMDRPLGLAGRVVVRGASGAPESRLVNLARPVGVVPNLAIHLNRDINKGFEYNAQNHLPVLVAAEGEVASETGAAASTPWALALIGRELGVAPDSILGADLFFVDAQRLCLFGAADELVNGPRLDDLVGCHAVLEAFLDASPCAHGQIACFLDNEEVGSRTVQGADSSFLRDVLGRICALSGCGTQDFYRALASSFCVSVDVAQAFNPSYSEKYDDRYSPILNGGPALKANANYRYATDAESEARFRILCAGVGVTCQKYMSRADIAPGTTIGPLGSSLTGIRTVDVGAPLLSMHAIRETVGARDHEAMVAALGALFRHGPAVGGSGDGAGA
jgi:aspartyl aminopeptidase